MHSESWLIGRQLDAVDERHARPRVVREQEVPVEVDVVEERCDLRRGGDAEPRLDHAAEHAAESERAPAAAAELELEPPEAAEGPFGAVRHVVGVAEPNCPARRRPSAPEAEQAPYRLAEELPVEVVERGIERCARRELARRQPRED